MNNSKSFTSILTFLLVVALAITGICFRSIVSGMAHSGDPQTDVKERLLNAVNAELPATEVMMTDNAASDLEVILARAAAKLRDDNADEAKVNEAEQKARELGRGLKAHGTRRLDGRVLIDRSTIARIRDWFCPCYPIC